MVGTILCEVSNSSDTSASLQKKTQDVVELCLRMVSTYRYLMLILGLGTLPNFAPSTDGNFWHPARV
jgi:hypothetical protein